MQLDAPSFFLWAPDTSYYVLIVMNYSNDDN